MIRDLLPPALIGQAQEIRRGSKEILRWNPLLAHEPRFGRWLGFDGGVLEHVINLKAVPKLTGDENRPMTFQWILFRAEERKTIASRNCPLSTRAWLGSALEPRCFVTRDTVEVTFGFVPAGAKFNAEEGISNSGATQRPLEQVAIEQWR